MDILPSIATVPAKEKQGAAGESVDARALGLTVAGGVPNREALRELHQNFRQDISAARQ